MNSLYELATKLMSKEDIDHYRSDLYLRKNKISDGLIEDYDLKSNVSIFVDNIDQVPWYEIMWEYEPFWKQSKNIKGDC